MVEEPRRLIPRSFFDRDPAGVAVELLGKLLVHGGRAGRIVEVEAYRGADDPASHAFRGRTGRNGSMFGPPGCLYVYRSYGIHWCANATCGGGMAVLIRALAPVCGVDGMRAARPGVGRDVDLCSGPGKLCQALGISGDLDGADLVTGERGVRLVDDGVSPPGTPVRTPRIGISVALDELLRFHVSDDPNVSRVHRPRVRA